MWAIVVGCLAAAGTQGLAQETEADAPAISAPAAAAADGEAEEAAVDQPAAEEAPADDSITEPPSDAEGAPPAGEEPGGAVPDESATAPLEPTEPADGAAPAGIDEPIDAAADAEDGAAGEEPGDALAGPGTTVTDPAGGSETTTGRGPFQIVLILVALFAVPVIVGNYLAKLWKMPDYAWKFSLILGSLAASLVIVTFGEFKAGPDLAGGITLIYELADTSAVDATAAATNDAPGGSERAREFDMELLIAALKERIDPTGTREVTIREYGPAIEIIIPKTGPDALEYVKRRITDLGQLEFRITADRSQPRDRPIIDQALQNPAAIKDVTLGGNRVAEWVAYDPEEFGPVEEEDGLLVKRMAGQTPEALVLIDEMNVTGEYLTSSTKGPDERGAPAVHFSFNRVGAQRFGQLTSQNLPNEATRALRYLGIVLDKRLISAPSIHSRIYDRGTISGGRMTETEVDYIISILNSGSLPAALSKEPISQQVISPTLGAVTIEKGSRAIVVSLVGVALFMLIYYRFAGIVACLVLSFNLLLVLAAMVLIKAAFTLPGLAGLVLTIGMSVDANILIYERIREELKNGAALRMAIRNGFSRAMSAIIDSNVTTIIAGIALWAFATDQVKGFAVTLILGILTSMYTAIFCARVIFDVAERRGWIKTVRMMQVLSSPNFDFLRARYAAFGLSLVLIAIGLAAVVGRGGQLLDIDFTGGSSVTFVLNEEADIRQVREALSSTELADRNLVIVERGEGGTRYSIDTSEQSVDRVKEVVGEAFPDRLQTFSVEVVDVTPFTEGAYSGSQATLRVNDLPDFDAEDGISYEALREYVVQAIAQADQPRIAPAIISDNYRPGSSVRLREWTVQLPEMDVEAAQSVFGQLVAAMESTPLFPLASKIGGRVSSNMQISAMYAIFISLLGMVAYLWLRFQRVIYGVAAAAAVVHDVLVTIGMLALSAYVVQSVPALASALQIDAFQINLTIVAAVLTIMGYSLNDTIVTFDRVREIKGKSPVLTADMVNRAVNQTLSRTLLTAVTVFIVVAILYFFGGEGIHGFAFAFLIGTVAGTYSTIYIASPVLVWLSGASFSASLPASAGSGALEPTR